MTHTLRPLDSARFDAEVLRAELPVLLEFSTPWCGPCRALEPLLEALARDFAGRLEVRAVEAEEHPELTTALGVRGFPTLVLFHGGREVARSLGLVSRARLLALLEPALGERPTPSERTPESASPSPARW